MNKNLAITLLQNQRQEIDSFKSGKASDPIFFKWSRDTSIAISKIFNNDISHNSDFQNISFESSWIVDIDEEKKYFIDRLIRADYLLQSFIDEINNFWSLEDSENSYSDLFVSLTRIDELKLIKSIEFDLAKLTRLCEELNNAYINKCYFTCAMIPRAILDHIPPIFGMKNFVEVINNYPFTKSIKKNLEHLDSSLRNISDTHLHKQISSKEILPSKQQINFSNDLDVLLGEVLRILK